ncbi:ATP-binding protein [Ruegeria sp.]|uniref:ATP-binding protein n=1 Tax=Ruegeria sp. TaxID=1879320 RepID=UPI003C79F93D
MARNCEHDCLELNFRAIAAPASAGIKLLGERLSDMGLPAEKIGDIKIALAEAINNVVEHAYADMAPAEVHIKCTLCPNRLDVELSDTGNPMPGLRLPGGIPASVETPRPNLPEGGFGWYLIRQLTSEIQYDRVDGRNQLFLRFDLAEKS